MTVALANVIAQLSQDPDSATRSTRSTRPDGSTRLTRSARSTGLRRGFRPTSSGASSCHELGLRTEKRGRRGFSLPHTCARENDDIAVDGAHIYKDTEENLVDLVRDDVSNPHTRACGERGRPETSSNLVGPRRALPPPAPATVLRHCRCSDCLNFSCVAGEHFCSEYIGGTAVVWATGERFCDPPPDAWHYCARYRGR